MENISRSKEKRLRKSLQLSALIFTIMAFIAA